MMTPPASNGNGDKDAEIDGDVTQSEGALKKSRLGIFHRILLAF